MSKTQIRPDTFKFLKTLALNNNREWFTLNKEKYIAAQSNMIEFADELLLHMNKHDNIENESGKKSLYRIYNDVRFSKDKSPYNARFACGLRRASKFKRGGYYLHIKPGNSFLACGFFSPNPADLLRIRKDIDLNYEDWHKILKLKSIKNNFGTLRGDAVATVPRGFNKEHLALNLLRHKQFILRHDFTDKEVLYPNFVKNVNEVFKSVRPFFDYMSLVLTTDLNGETTI